MPSLLRVASFRKPSRKIWAVTTVSIIAVVAAIRSTLHGHLLHAASTLDNGVRDSWVSNSLNFPHPTSIARDNLKNGSSYVTGFAISGFTNECIAYMQVIYLGILSGRIPVIPPIIPSAHVSENAGMMRFGDVFNLTNLRDKLRLPVLEWGDVKVLYPNASILEEPLPTDPALEHFGCWSTQSRNSDFPTWFGDSENLLKLDLSFTRVPNFAYLNESDRDDIHTTFAGLSATILPKHPHPSSQDLPLMAESRLGSILPPDEQLACFDFLFYLSSGLETFEFEKRWSPAWNRVGSHLEFNEPLVKLAQSHLYRLMNVDEGGLPPVISVHIRRGDFGGQCKEGGTPPCYIALSRFRDAVDDIQKELFQKKGINATHILVASDEKNATFWSEIESYGWTYINHTAERTVETLGEWYPILIDQAALSLGIGFVGTQSSTFSLLTARRIEDWNDGEAKMLSMWN